MSAKLNLRLAAQRAARRAAAPAPPGPPDIGPLIARIDEISKVARGAWFGLLAYLAFVAIAVFRTEDVDFFVPSRQTQLPLINIAIPTNWFFLAAPFVGLVLHGYLHFQLAKLWELLGEARTKAGGEAAAARAYPWMINDFFLTWGRGNRPAPRRPLTGLSNLASRLLVWLATPVALFAFWVRSQPAHDEWLTLWIALNLALAVWVARASWVGFAAAAWPGRTMSVWRRVFGSVAVALFGVLGLPALLIVSWLRTEGGLDHQAMAVIDWLEQNELMERFEEDEARDLTADMVQEEWVRARFPELEDFRLTDRDGDFIEKPAVPRWIVSLYPAMWSATTLAPIDLRNVELVERPDDWDGWSEARATFQASWCKAAGIEHEDCALLPWPEEKQEESRAALRSARCVEAKDRPDCDGWFAAREARLTAAWEHMREGVLDDLGALDLSGADLRGADLSGAFLARADLSGARMEGAVLRGARMEGAVLWQARMEGADLRGARLEGADLWQARMEGADLSGARMEGAVLRGARMEGAVLRGARLEGADLSGARMERADLSGARMERADLSGARMEGADRAGATIGPSPAQSAVLSEVKNLDQSMLDNVIGDAQTILPAGPAPDTGEPFFVWSCWETPPEGFEDMVTRVAEYSFDSADVLRARWLCAPENPRVKFMYPLPPPMTPLPLR